MSKRCQTEMTRNIGTGWVRYEDDDIGASILLGVKDLHGRLCPVSMEISAPEGMTSSTLRGIKLAQLVAWVNRPATARLIRQRLAVSDSTKTHLLGDVAKHCPTMQLSPVTHADVQLAVPPRRPYGDRFYRTFADVYERIQGQVPYPAQFIADANHVQPTQVHKWRKVARAKQFLD